jgi:hypothetical protein
VRPMTRILKRLAVWFLEILCEVSLLALTVVALLGHHGYTFGFDLRLYMLSIAFVMFMTGYLLTTLLLRSLWRPQRLWSYPLVGAFLFLLHFQILNWAAGGEWEPSISIRIRVFGACIVFGCTLAGSYVLPKWAPAPSQTPQRAQP